MVRNSLANGVEMIGENYDFSGEKFIPAFIPAGSLVLIHGGVVHKSAPNKSAIPRNAYTFHVIEGDESVIYFNDNWLQPRPDPVVSFKNM